MIWKLTWCAMAVLLAAPGAPPALAAHGAPIPVPTVQAEYVKRLLGAGEPVTLIDLRPAESFGQGRLPGARSVPWAQLRRRYGEIPRTGPVILYCSCSPEEINTAYRFLHGEGYRNVSVLEEGFAGWVKRGYGLER
jgi:ArsR family transcriptional regulator